MSGADGGRAAHALFRSLLGAWALDACSGQEAGAVEAHLNDCGSCAEEAVRLRGAVRFLSPEEPLDPDPLLRTEVLRECLDRRPAGVAVPPWAAPYDAETARLDALLRDLGDAEWETPVTLSWSSGARRLTLCGVLAHLGSVDGLVSTALGLPDPLGPGAPRTRAERTDLAEERCRAHGPPFVREKWRSQTRGIVRAAALAPAGGGAPPVDFAEFALPLPDALRYRAFECWVHAQDVAEAVDYPYGPPAADHLNQLIDLAARMLPESLALRRRAGRAALPGRLTEAGRPGRAVRLEIGGDGGGTWLVPLDSPRAAVSGESSVARLALDGLEFCRLAAGHADPGRVAAGVEGDAAAVHEVLHATAALSRI
ncbi:maleylpyruvate isomerase family mycothiol-dependent enzyme [Streptomyces sp. HB2AG]|uniref:maleylpyruvate isomerase family mycothiol-dependent enzyme n=1 Tax=Streptomyces sp. HB2AG TaxID=2983400 RepID=UPI0022AAD1F5|nr:maleylpyruvate isomerase family mycothiol-dependent enzyme [Streptomyces sp. HB2AG]MCZ2527804.1 maleylpyruvate isomerase family mycothiol-dependent enzyme [Streptomyces sp. HB2AG]